MPWFTIFKIVVSLTVAGLLLLQRCYCSETLRSLPQWYSFLHLVFMGLNFGIGFGTLYRLLVG